MPDKDGDPKTMLIANEMQMAEKTKLTQLLRQYKDVFAWSFEDIKGLDPAFCQHLRDLTGFRVTRCRILIPLVSDSRSCGWETEVWKCSQVAETLILRTRCETPM